MKAPFLWCASLHEIQRKRSHVNWRQYFLPTLLRLSSKACIFTSSLDFMSSNDASAALCLHENLLNFIDDSLAQILGGVSSSLHCNSALHGRHPRSSDLWLVPSLICIDWPPIITGIVAPIGKTSDHFSFEYIQYKEYIFCTYRYIWIYSIYRLWCQKQLFGKTL